MAPKLPEELLLRILTYASEQRKLQPWYYDAWTTTLCSARLVSREFSRVATSLLFAIYEGGQTNHSLSSLMEVMLKRPQFRPLLHEVLLSSQFLYTEYKVDHPIVVYTRKGGPMPPQPPLTAAMNAQIEEHLTTLPLGEDDLPMLLDSMSRHFHDALMLVLLVLCKDIVRMEFTDQEYRVPLHETPLFRTLDYLIPQGFILNSLTRLTISHWDTEGATGFSWQQLLRCPNLTEFIGNRIGDLQDTEDHKLLQTPCPSIQKITLHETEMKAGGLSYLLQITPGLRSLHINWTGVLPDADEEYTCGGMGDALRQHGGKLTHLSIHMGEGWLCNDLVSSIGDLRPLAELEQLAFSDWEIFDSLSPREVYLENVLPASLQKLRCFSTTQWAATSSYMIPENVHYEGPEAWWTYSHEPQYYDGTQSPFE